jgi:hypothetical protein
MSKTRSASKRKSTPKSKQPFLVEPLRDAAGLIRQPELDPEDREMNDQRELQYLQRKLAALHYEQHERPAVLAKIAELKEILAQHQRTPTGVAPEEFAVS